MLGKLLAKNMMRNTPQRDDIQGTAIGILAGCRGALFWSVSGMRRCLLRKSRRIDWGTVIGVRYLQHELNCETLN